MIALFYILPKIGIYLGKNGDPLLDEQGRNFELWIFDLKDII